MSAWGVSTGFRTPQKFRLHLSSQSVCWLACHPRHSTVPALEASKAQGHLGYQTRWKSPSKDGLFSVGQQSGAQKKLLQLPHFEGHFGAKLTAIST